MKTVQNYLLAFILTCALSGCFSRGNAPKNINGYIFTTVSDGSSDPSSKNKTANYYFFDDGTYKLVLDGQKNAVGDFTYKKTGANTGDVIISYVIDRSEKSYTMTFTFLTTDVGNWKVTYQDENEEDESGSFEVKAKM